MLGRPVTLEGVTDEEESEDALGLTLTPDDWDLWATWLDLHHARPAGGFGPAPIGWCELDAYQRVRRVRFEGDEVDTLLRIDRLWLESAHEAMKAAPKGQ